jgi:hypothetical protein
LLVISTLSAGARAACAQATPEQQLEKEVPELRSVTGETPRAVADAMVRSLLARFEQLATKSSDAAGEALRPKASEAPAAAPASAASASAPAAAPKAESPVPARPVQSLLPLDPIYRFVDRAGHVVYTNIVETVPLEERERGKLELRLITADTELGVELSARLRQEHETRIQTPVCDQLRAAIDTPPLRRLWDEHAPLLGGAAMLVAFVLFIPSMLGRFGVSLWMRMLATIIPLMAVIALGTLGYEQARTSLQAQQLQAQPCLADTFDKLTREGGGLDCQAELLRSLVALQASQGAADAAHLGSAEP